MPSLSDIAAALAVVAFAIGAPLGAEALRFLSHLN